MEVILSESEVEFIVHILSKYYYIKEIRDICLILVSHLPLQRDPDV